MIGVGVGGGGWRGRRGGEEGEEGGGVFFHCELVNLMFMLSLIAIINGVIIVMPLVVTMKGNLGEVCRIEA